MLKRTVLLSAALVALLCASSFARPRTAPAPADVFGSLPAGDLIAAVDFATLVNKTIPAVLASRPESLQKLNANITKVQTDYGIDLRQIRSVSISASPFAGGSQWVALVEGRLDALAAPKAAAALAQTYVKLHPGFTVQAETYEGATIHVFSKTGGTARDTFAVSVLDATTGLYGTPAGVRSALEVRAAKVPAAASRRDLVDALGQAEAGAPVRFAAAFPKELAASGDDPFTKSLASIQVIFGTLGVDAQNAVALRSTARTLSAADAKVVHANLSAVVDLGRQLAANKPEIAAIVQNVKLTTLGSDVLLSMTLPPDQLDMLFRALDKNSAILAER